MNKLKKLILAKLGVEYTYPKIKRDVLSLVKTYDIPEIETTQIDIVMPTFNRLKQTKRTIENLYKLYTQDKFNLILVDNKSNDGTGEYLNILKGNYSNIKVIHLDSNLGGAGARNEGLKYVKNEYVAFLDNDIYIMPGYFENLIKTLEDEDKTTIAAQSKVVMPNGLIQINRPFYVIENKWIIFQDLDFEKDFKEPSAEISQSLNWTPSGATLWRSEIFEKYSFDLTLGTYYEDNEFSFRLNKEGYEFKNNHKAICLHYSSAFVPDESSDKSYSEGRFGKDAIKQALKNFYNKHGLYLIYGNIDGHIAHIGFKSREEYINFLED